MTYLEPSAAVLGLNLVTVSEPVPVPSPQGSGVMDTDGVDGLDLKASALQVVDEESKRGRSISAWEDVSVHEETPHKILVLPRLAESSNLQEENSIIVKHVINLFQESLEVADTNVLSHLEAGDLVVLALWNRDIAVVHAEDSALLLGDTSLAETVVSPGSLVTAKGDTSHLSAKVDTGKLGQGSPAASNIKHALVLLEVNLLANNGKLVVLELLKGLLLGDVRNNAGGVNHTWAKEPPVEIIASVIVVSDLLLI
jgi:hypothetical protein